MKGSPAKAAGTRGVTPGLPTGYTVYRHPGAPDEGKPGENSRDQSRNPWFTNNLHGIPAPGKGRKRRCSSHRCSGFRLMLCLPGRLRRPSTSPSRRRLPPCTIAVSASAGSRSTWASTTTRPRRLWAGSVRVDCGWVRFRALAALVLVPAVARFRPLLPVGPVALGRLRTARRCSYRRISSCLRRLPFFAFRSACGAPLALCARSLARRRIRLSSAPGLFLAFGALAFRALSALPRLLEALFPLRHPCARVAGFVNPPSVLEHEFGLRLG